ncbi:MAG: adenine phosphoribosyltransferase [Verrucomicrobiae bacterium]|nr:adenine phosphoribosyltransferase [Verrucomicrobiae bacterium]
MNDSLTRLKNAVRDVPDFPIPGIVFKDITPILADPKLLATAVEWFADQARGQGVDAVVGIDARGFIFSGAVAHALGVGLVPVRKKGKLPWKTESVRYALEYGENELQIHQDAFAAAKRVCIVDDLLATGGTALAAARLAEKAGGEVAGFAFLIELRFLKGREKLAAYPVASAIAY